MLFVIKFQIKNKQKTRQIIIALRLKRLFITVFGASPLCVVASNFFTNFSVKWQQASVYHFFTTSALNTCQKFARLWAWAKLWHLLGHSGKLLTITKAIEVIFYGVHSSSAASKQEKAESAVPRQSTATCGGVRRRRLQQACLLPALPSYSAVLYGCSCNPPNPLYQTLCMLYVVLLQ